LFVSVVVIPNLPPLSIKFIEEPVEMDAPSGAENIGADYCHLGLPAATSF
jgi:hypothetical protein